MPQTLAASFASFALTLSVGGSSSSMLQHRFHTEITINAPPERVWAVLSAADQYPEWNPLVSKLEGAWVVGEKLRVTVRSRSGSSMDFRPTVLILEPGRELVWRGRLGVPGMFDGRHRFALEALPDGRTRFIHGERFSGVLVPFFRSKLDRDSLPLFHAMNEALKRRVESGVKE